MNLKRTGFLLFIVLLFSHCSSTGGGSRVNRRSFSISETIWNYQDKDWSYTIKFNKDGTISSTHPNGNRPQQDTWRQMNRRVNFQLTNGYSKYKGKISDTTIIVGKAKNGKTKWKWSLKRMDIDE